MELYKINCTKCRKKTIHYIINLSRNKGLKLKCSSCGYIKKRYIHAQVIELMKIKKEIITTGGEINNNGV